MSYGKHWEEYPIEKGEVWVEKRTQSKLSVCDIISGIPSYMADADMIYSDTPWSLQNTNMFNKKSGRDYIYSFTEFYNPLFKHIQNINPKVCYLEIGKQELNTFTQEMQKLFPVIQSWQIVYYRKNPCFLIRGGYAAVNIDFTGCDDTETPNLAIDWEKPYCVADFCTGRGLTAIAAHKNRVRFVGTELNKRKLAVCINNCKKLGFEYEKSFH